MLMEMYSLLESRVTFSRSFLTWIVFVLVEFQRFQNGRLKLRGVELYF